MSWWANSVYTRLILGVKVKDATAGFKCWRRATLEGIGLDRVRSNGYVFQVEMAYLTEKLGYRFLEIPIYFEDRRIGQSKMTMPVKIEAALRTWQIRWRHRNASGHSDDPANVSRTVDHAGMDCEMGWSFAIQKDGFRIWALCSSSCSCLSSSSGR